MQHLLGGFVSVPKLKQLLYIPVPEWQMVGVAPS